MKTDNRRLLTFIAVSLVAHAALLVSLGAPSASGSGAAADGMEVVIGAATGTAEKPEERHATVEDTKPAEVEKPDPRAVAVDKPETKPVEVTRPEPRLPEARPVDVARLDPAPATPKPVEIRRPDARQPDPKPVEVRKAEPKRPDVKPVEFRKAEPKRPDVKPVEVRKVDPTKPDTRKVEIKKIEPPKPVRKAETKPRPQPKTKPQPKARPVARKRAAPNPRAKPKATPKETARATAPKPKSRQEAALRPGEDGTSDAGTGRGDGVVPVMRAPRFGQTPRPASYPRLSVQREEEGTVVVRALVHRRGTPSQVRVWRSSGYPRLDHAALEAVREWVFLPMQRRGRAVTAWVEIPVRFRLH